MLLVAKRGSRFAKLSYKYVCLLRRMIYRRVDGYEFNYVIVIEKLKYNGAFPEISRSPHFLFCENIFVKITSV